MRSSLGVFTFLIITTLFFYFLLENAVHEQEIHKDETSNFIYPFHKKKERIISKCKRIALVLSEWNEDHDYWIYQDEFINIYLNGEMDYIRVGIIKNKVATVLKADYDREDKIPFKDWSISSYRKGDWIEYVKHLYEKTRGKPVNKKKHFKPIDDSDIDYPGGD